MTAWVFALISSACSSMQSAFTKLGSKAAAPSGSMSFNAAKTGSVVLVFLAPAFCGFAFHLPTLFYALLYSCALITSTFCGYMALMKGSMALSSLIASYSMIIPVVYGLGFLDEKVYPIKLVGIVLLLFSLFLLTKKNSKNKFEKSWFFYIGVTFFTNGICSVIQKHHQMLYPGSYLKEFTLVSFGIMFLFFLLVSVIRKEQPNAASFKYAVPAGLTMGGMNFLTLSLAHKMDASVLFPAVTVLSALFNFGVSAMLFKEKFSKLQILGIVLGIVSVILIK